MREYKYGVRLRSNNGGDVFVYFDDLDDRKIFLELLNYGLTKSAITLFEVSEKQEEE